MNKSLTSLFAAAATIAGISSSYASAPVISALPDIIVGDQENNYAGTDNNYFVFTNAFLFDSYASDADTTVSSLLWSFDQDTATPAAPATWYTVNGKNPIYNTTAGQAGDPAGTAHLLPGASDLRSVSAYASFRDVVYSPGSGPLTASFPNSNQVNSHAAGRLLTFWASDQQNVTSDTVLVKTVDGAFDVKSDVDGVVYENDDLFTSSNGWIATKPTATTYESCAFVSTSGGELRGTVLPAPAAINYHRAAGWIESPHAVGDPSNLHLTYGEVGSKFVRAKFFLYTFGSVTSNGNVNTIPNLRLRITTRYSFGMMADLNHHSVTYPANVSPYADDFTPSTNAALPSVYRVDMDPPETLPYIVSNPD